MKTIIHISADFPDPLVPGKTTAVQSLIEAAPEHRHIVYSLNRVGWRTGIAARPFGDGNLAIAYGAPSYGVRLSHHLTHVADFILGDIEKRALRPDLIHAHKFTVEGLIAHRLCQNLRCAYIASIWGATDRRIFEAKPGLRGAFRTIARETAFLLPAAPWTRDYFAKALQTDRGQLQLLSVITKADAVLPPIICEKPRLVSIFAFDFWKRKGFPVLVKAVAQASKAVPELTLDVYGRGGPKALIDMEGHIREAQVEDRVALRNQLDHRDVQTVMNGYAGFVLPSRPETYGMVYVEALLAGLPILWSQNEGVDGFFNTMDIGHCCNPQSVEDVADGLRHITAQQARLKRKIGFLQSQGAFDALRSEAIGARYRQILALAIGHGAQAAASAA
ncbi:MAG: glycosyltransferase [Rhodomicrobiaceae bacterium]